MTGTGRLKKKAGIKKKKTTTKAEKHNNIEFYQNREAHPIDRDLFWWTAAFMVIFLFVVIC